MILQQAGRQAVRQGQFVGPYVIVVAVNDDDVNSNDYFTFFFSLALISHSSKLLFFVCIGISVVCMYVLMWHVSGYTVETPVLLCVCSWNAHLFVLCNILFLCRLEQRFKEWTGRFHFAAYSCTMHYFSGKITWNQAAAARRSSECRWSRRTKTGVATIQVCSKKKTNNTDALMAKRNNYDNEEEEEHSKSK